MSLAGLNVLVTRPNGQGDDLVAAIEQAGGIAHHIPVLTIKPLDPTTDLEHVQACKRHIMDLDHFRQVIFVSTNAVRFGMAWIEDYWPQLPTGLTWHAIGRGTAAQLAAAGVDVAARGAIAGQSAMNSEALLQHPALQAIDGQKILIVRGVGGREHLNTQLTQRGAKVSYVECYHRALPAQGASDLRRLLKQSLDIICINSADSLHNLCCLAGNEMLTVLQNKILLVPSQRVRKIAGQRGFNNICVAQNASDQAILAGLLAVAGMEK